MWRVARSVTCRLPATYVLVCCAIMAALLLNMSYLTMDGMAPAIFILTQCSTEYRKYYDCSIQHYTVEFFFVDWKFFRLCSKYIFEFTALSVLAIYLLISFAIMIALFLFDHGLVVWCRNGKLKVARAIFKSF